MAFLNKYSEPVQESWIDANGHLNEGYYLVACSKSSFPWLAQVGVEEDYPDKTGAALYTAETHIRYLDEVRAPAILDLEYLVLRSDAKRIHCACVIKVDGRERATIEFVYLHIDIKSGRTTPMPEEMQAMLKAQEVSELPDWSDRQITLKRSS
jgi:acyl-CoA thioester hydrolase